MTEDRGEVREIRFNPRTLTYEGRVSFRDGPLAQDVPCSLRFPVPPSDEVVRDALLRQAREKRGPRRIEPVSHIRNPAPRLPVLPLTGDDGMRLDRRSA